MTMTYKRICDVCGEEIKDVYYSVRKMSGHALADAFGGEDHWCTPCVDTARQRMETANR